MWILAASVAVLFLLGYLLYARMIQLKYTALEALSGIDVQLRQRHDLLPNLLKLARRYMEHETRLIKEVTELRNHAEKVFEGSDPAELAKHFSAENALTGGIGRLFAMMEDYPELTAHHTILEAQTANQELEGHIAAARRFYNTAVADLNIAIETFPGPWIAPLANANSMPFYEVEAATVREPVDADDFLR